ncbi:hypothetical protein [Salirhabdus salicampi]|uniref:hypothetical protein n=1 Tax=Salirhabdus salicampi TaxID=476102 RepID=UPI0020C1BC6D|nr:hypothetical protein [Salirhabdus salicampi]MCP8615811.1 hypothetical protein [Salirhabdus salicampi]
MSNSAKRTLIITPLNDQLKPFYTTITNKNLKDCIISHCFGTLISQPYSNTLREIMKMILSQPIDAIYVIGEVEQPLTINIEKSLGKMGITEEDFQILHIQPKQWIEWLNRPIDVEGVVQENVQMLKEHPLIPGSINIYGCTVDTRTGEYQFI